MKATETSSFTRKQPGLGLYWQSCPTPKKKPEITNFALCVLPPWRLPSHPSLFWKKPGPGLLLPGIILSLKNQKQQTLGICSLDAGSSGMKVTVFSPLSRSKTRSGLFGIFPCPEKDLPLWGPQGEELEKARFGCRLIVGKICKGSSPVLPQLGGIGLSILRTQGSNLLNHVG